MTRRLPILVVLIAALLSAGCFDFLQNKPTAPTGTATQQLAGTWGSAAPTGLPNTCTSFTLVVTETTQTTAAGTFTATCGALSVTGSATATATSSSTMSLNVTGTASGGGVSSCAFAISGTAQIDDTTLHVTYAGTTCLGPVAGSEILTKK